MNQKELESKILELKAKQSDVFKKKKADRDMDVLAAVRNELNELKKQAKAFYKRQNG